MWFIRLAFFVIQCDNVFPCFGESSAEEMGPADVILFLEGSFEAGLEALVEGIVIGEYEGRGLVR